MKTTHNLLLITIAAALGAASCARQQTPATAEQQQPGAAPIAAVPAPAPTPAAPVRESAWKPAPAKAGHPNSAPAPANAPTPAATPAPQAVAPVAQSRPAAPPPPQAMKVTLDAGSILAVRVGETLTSEKNESGDSWSGTLAEPLVINGLVIAERGSRVQGRVADVKRAGRVKGVAQMSLELTRFETADGQRIAVRTGAFSAHGKDETKKDVGKVAIASGIGAAIGAIAGGGKGAAIGAGVGAGAGTGVVLATRGGPAVIATESLIRFRVEEPVTITEKVK